MTKSQTMYYVLAVVAIVVFTYLYTSIVEAPHKTETEQVEDTTVTQGMVTTGDENTQTEPEVSESAPDNETGTTPPSVELELGTELTLPPHPLYGSSWTWQSSQLADGTKITPRRPGAFVLSFIDAGRMSSKTDCNSLGGEYKVAKDTLIFGEMMMTLMYCENSDEGVYTEQLRSVQRYGIDGDTLTLWFVNGGEMYFKLVN